MIDAGPSAGLSQRDDLVRDIDRPGGLPVLVSHDIHGRPLARQPDHRGDEVRPVRAVEPGRPDHVAGAGEQPEHGLLAGQLGAPVRGARPGAVIFRVGQPAVAAEHVVSGHVHQDRATRGAGGGDVLCALPVHQERIFLVCLGIVYGRAGGAVDHDGRPVPLHRAADRGLVSDVQIAAGQAGHVLAAALQGGHEVPAEHAPAPATTHVLMS